MFQRLRQNPKVGTSLRLVDPFLTVHCGSVHPLMSNKHTVLARELKVDGAVCCAVGQCTHFFLHAGIIKAGCQEAIRLLLV